MSKVKLLLIALCFIGLRAHALQSGETYGDWTVTCQMSQVEGIEICALEQELVDENQQTVARITIVRSKSSEIVVSVKVPLLVNLQAGLGLGVDGSNLSRTKFFSCDVEGCTSLIKFDDEKLNRLRKGNKLNIGVYVADKKKVMDASLKGITKGLKNL